MVLIKKFSVFTGARSEYGILKTLMKLISDDKSLEFNLFVSGMHLSPEFGHTIDSIINDGFKPIIPIEILLSSDTKTGTVKSIALGILGITEKFSLINPDILFVLGDRFETFAASISAIHSNIILAHIHGGDQGQAVFDDYYRKSITIFANLHFVATLNSMKNVLLMGANPKFVFLSGSPTQDDIKNLKAISRENLSKKFSFNMNSNWVIVIYHPVKNIEDSIKEFDLMLEVLKEYENKFDLQFMLLHPNADSGGRILIKKIAQFEGLQRWKVEKNLMRIEYLSLLKESKFIIGNSSSGIIDTPLLGIPAINIGKRQEGRDRSSNVIDVHQNKMEISKAVDKIFFDPDYTKTLKGNQNLIYGDGNASARILNTVKNLKTDQEMFNSRFFDNMNVVQELLHIKKIDYSLFGNNALNAFDLLKLFKNED